MAAILSVTYTPNYSGCHRICFKSTQPDYCVYTDNSPSVVGIEKTTTIDLTDYEECLVDYPIPVGCGDATLDGYVQPCCTDPASLDNRVSFSALFEQTPCSAYSVQCLESGIGTITINNAGYGWPIGVVPTVTVTDSSGLGTGFAADVTMDCLPGDNFCSIDDIFITNNGQNYYDLNDLTVNVSPAPTCISNELITNGNFSDGLNDWTISPTLSPPVWYMAGSQPRYAIDQYGGSVYGTISQNILTPGKTYNINLDAVMGTNAGSVTLIITAGTFDISGTQPNQYSFTHPIGPIFSGPLSTTLTCTGSTEFSLTFISDSLEPIASRASVDNVSVIEICTAINPDLEVTEIDDCGTFTVPSCNQNPNPTLYELWGGSASINTINVCSPSPGPTGDKYYIQPNPTGPETFGPDLVDFTDPGNLTLTGDLLWNCVFSPYVNGICSPELALGGQVIFNGLTLGKTYAVMLNANSLLSSTITLISGTTSIPISGSGFYPTLGETYTFVADSTQVIVDMPSQPKGVALGQFSITEVIPGPPISCCDCKSYNVIVRNPIDVYYTSCNQTIDVVSVEAGALGATVCAVTDSVWPVNPAENGEILAITEVGDCTPV